MLRNPHLGRSRWTVFDVVGLGVVLAGLALGTASYFASDAKDAKAPPLRTPGSLTEQVTAGRYEVYASPTYPTGLDAVIRAAVVVSEDGNALPLVPHDTGFLQRNNGSKYASVAYVTFPHAGTITVSASSAVGTVVVASPHSSAPSRGLVAAIGLVVVGVIVVLYGIRSLERERDRPGRPGEP